MLRLARVDQPRVFPLRKVQRATSQRIDANLANQRSRHPSEVVVGAVRRSRESLRARGLPRMLRQHFQRKLPQRRVSKGRHAAPTPHAPVDESLVDIDMVCSAVLGGVPASWIATKSIPNERLLSDRTASGALSSVMLRPFAANDATEIVGERRHFDTNQTFTLILHEPATTEPSHRDRDVWAAHARELG